MALKKIQLEDFISLLKQKITLTEVLECLEDKQYLKNEAQNTNVVYLDKERQSRKGLNRWRN